MEKREIFDIVVRHAREVVPSLETHPFQWNDALKDLGANSLDRSEIAIMTLETLALRVALVDVAKAGNIGELVEILHGKLQAR